LQQMKARGMQPPARIEVRDGEWYVPVVRGVAFNSDAELEAYLVADNRLVELGGWDDETLAALLSDLAAEDEELLAATGYDADDLDALLAETLVFGETSTDRDGQSVSSTWQQVSGTENCRVIIGDLETRLTAETGARLTGWLMARYETGAQPIHESLEALVVAGLGAV